MASRKFPRIPGYVPEPLPEPKKLGVSFQRFSNTDIKDEPVDVESMMAVRFTLPDGSWIDVECRVRDGVNGLCVRGERGLGIVMGVSNSFWIVPEKR